MNTKWLPYYLSPNRRVFIPLWLPSLIFGGLLFWSLLPALVCRKRKKLGLCLKCGYDLRASKDRCPECGMEMRGSVPAHQPNGDNNETD